MMHETQKANGKLKQAQSIQAQIGGMASDIVDDSVGKAHAAADYVSNRVDALKDTGVQAYKKAEAGVKAKPAQSVAFAFGAGMLATWLLGRKWS